MKIRPSHEYCIRDDAIIGNCETAALISPDGGIDWLCLPMLVPSTAVDHQLDRDGIPGFHRYILTNFLIGWREVKS